uniref:hypothetical protein n=1 Tax=Theobroma cacao TaxID=3641 RepID=UPI0021D52D23|nr:hypothetical protein OF223_mgp08 [Theobroma cacao]YP_010500546.1 hypothetical protein OF241_mgp17 [Theobroma grandiflorum]UXB55747.1 hypothetical protein [Theobroma cacao]UXB55779.1 hypothetical protein [Theobroma grandiflorum]
MDESPIGVILQRKKKKDLSRVVSVVDGIALVYGLKDIQAGEMVYFASGVTGIAMNLEKDKVGVILCGSETNIQEGDHVKRTGEIVSVPANA